MERSWVGRCDGQAGRFLVREGRSHNLRHSTKGAEWLQAPVTSSFALNPVFSHVVGWGTRPEYELGAGHLVFLQDQEEGADRDPEACEGSGPSGLLRSMR